MHLLRLLSTAVGEQSSWRSVAGSPTGKRRLTRRDGPSNQRAEGTSRDRAISVPGNSCKMEVRLLKTILKDIAAVETCWERACTGSARRRGSSELCRVCHRQNMTLNTAPCSRQTHPTVAAMRTVVTNYHQKRQTQLFACCARRFHFETRKAR